MQITSCQIFPLTLLQCEYSFTSKTIRNERQKQSFDRLPAHGAFHGLGFLLIYLRDFAPGKEEWIARYTVGKHIESRLAHVHGNLFAFLNIVIGFLLLHFGGRLRSAKPISWLALTGMLMPLFGDAGPPWASMASEKA